MECGAIGAEQGPRAILNAVRTAVREDLEGLALIEIVVLGPDQIVVEVGVVATADVDNLECGAVAGD